jgi:transcription elongation factor Elf1
MGRRKSKAKVTKKVQMVVPKVFDCPFCNHSKTVECRIDSKINMGEIKCRVCDANFQTQTNFLTEAIDIYSEWIDACEEANAPSNLEASSRRFLQDSQRGRGPAEHKSIDLGGRNDDEDDDAKYAALNPETAADRAFVVDDIGAADSDEEFGGGPTTNPTPKTNTNTNPNNASSSSSSSSRSNQAADVDDEDADDVGLAPRADDFDSD